MVSESERGGVTPFGSAATGGAFLTVAVAPLAAAFLLFRNREG